MKNKTDFTQHQQHIIYRNICFGLFFNLVVSPLTATGFDTYFPLTAVHLTIPTDKEAINIYQKYPLAKFNAKFLNIDDDEQQPPPFIPSVRQDAGKTNGNENKFHYEIYNNYGFISINEQTGEIWVMENEKFSELKNNVTLFISAKPKRRSKDKKNSVARMSFTLRPIRSSLSEFCHNYEKSCYWDSSGYTVVENKIEKNKLIGALGPSIYRKLCPQYTVQYILMNATSYFNIKDNELYSTNVTFDHDTFRPGPTVRITVLCSIYEKTNKIQTIEKTLEIVVIDRNDSPPEIQNSKNITIELNDPHFVMGTEIGQPNIIFADNDSLSVNANITYVILNDYLEIIKPQCKAYEADHRGLKNSIINCKLIFSRSGILRKSPYCVDFAAFDKTVVRGASNKQIGHNKTASVNICIIADLSQIHDTDKPAAQALQSYDRRKSRKNRKYIQSSEEASSSDESAGHSSSYKQQRVVDFIDPIYPNVQEVIVHRIATNLSRIIQPINMKEMMKVGVSPKFRLNDNQLTNNAFGLTSVAGIMFVNNSTALKMLPETRYNITIMWERKSLQLTIRLESNYRPLETTCAQERFDEMPPYEYCAQIGTKKDCLKSCGYGTDGRNCQWRANNLTSLTTKYATCSVNLTTCPDNICDPLEQLGQNIEKFVCPQDCTEHIFGPSNKNMETKQGILSAMGLCTCDVFGKCTCGPHEIGPPKQKSLSNKTIKMNNEIMMGDDVDAMVGPKAIDKSANMQQRTAQCGLPCIALVIMCPVVLSVIIISLFMFRRNYVRKAKKEQKGFASNAQLSSDGPRETETETLNDLPLIPLIPNTEFTFKTESNPKWEFSRSQLVLDITLGEGEFGKVVKGYATNIADKPGVTTVAVKMLKTGANSVEWLALLSEYQLLQEVQHPNVIRLLGACTLESPLVIIEYAKYGSLKNYLRLSRKLECIGDNELLDDVAPVTVKDVLSFAWQICKGMVYLTEIKLVHRDLAARNVLLAEGKICKVSDFGLTRDVYEDDAYLKRSKDRVPVKWMAPESLADYVYTTRSDVWAFGILAWEIITLGASPYPGVPPQNLYHLLKNGYRMERPENCSEQIYSIIRSCWADDPMARPSFKMLASQWEKLLGNNTKYLELVDATAISSVSNPLYCTTTTPDDEAIQNYRNMELESSNENIDLDRIDHLWHPPSEEPNTKPIPTSVLLGYDVPRPLIEAKTVEQNLRYENDLTIPMNVRNLNKSMETEFLVGLKHYDSPVKQRRRSYVDMNNGGALVEANACWRSSESSNGGYNLDMKNLDTKKRLSKTISFRFSSLLNLNDHLTAPM